MSKIFIFGDNIDTDIIIAARYLNVTESCHLAAHCMEDGDPNFAKNVRPGDIIIAGENFGCGSSREHAPMALRACGIKAVVAKSFARIFYRNAVNTGLAIVECREACDRFNPKDIADVDFETGTVYNRTTGEEFYGVPFPPFIRAIIEKGGLLNCLNEFKN